MPLRFFIVLLLVEKETWKARKLCSRIVAIMSTQALV